MTTKTGFLYHEICMWHDTGNRSIYDDCGIYFQPTTSYENPETKRRLKNLLEVSGAMKQLMPIDSDLAPIEALHRFHTERYITSLSEQSEKGAGDAGEGSPFAQNGFTIARQSSGMAIQAMESVLKGEVKNAYCLSRPPGHHAKRDTGSGFCLLGNIPIAIMSAQAKKLVKRVAVIDWDVHHGNGTQEAFYDSADVLTISIHHDNNFPVNSGSASERGTGEGEGYNVNIPLPAGSGIGAYISVLEELIVPALQRFKPEMIVVACGFDAAAVDPLGPMILNSNTYRKMTKILMREAKTLCGDKLVMIHEGGYSPSYVPFCGLAVIEEMSGQRTEVVDTLSDEIALWGQQTTQPHQQALIDSLQALVKDIC
ncbi:class II histone deacetylase [uncultured Psychromonas sp.]|jgi:acetoin utilization deacetylase AcuC-like enzyme|uniref:class II histone deacetylase n=1 Tax=uncultured Psychromonas sp. TaxID=173974 RepID=UPI0026231F10|nr:class II histone deacetylase [uncultured Psychromonas sp.]